jgi:hypothetical protein
MPCPLKISKHEGGGLLVTPSHHTAPLHTKNGVPRVITSEATTPSPEGHKDLEHSKWLTYKDNVAKSIKALKLKGLSLTRMHYI